MSTTPYAQYARDLKLLVRDARRGYWQGITEDVTHALDGYAASQARSLLSRETRRAIGAFFTSGDLRTSFAALLAVNSDGQMRRFADPSCGVGDLLLAASETLPLEATAEETLKAWSTQLAGCDIEEPFVQTARSRLILQVLLRHRIEDSPCLATESAVSSAFGHVAVGDGLSKLESGRLADCHILLNPPFNSVDAEFKYQWSSGKTSLAAIFAAAAAASLNNDGRISAILPDVLRSGSRYASWRAHMEKYVAVRSATTYGLFDSYTDVDVFLLDAQEGRSLAREAFEWWRPAALDRRLTDLFDVRVGPVVDNRDLHEGPVVPFLIARDLPGSGETGVPSRTRQFGGRLTPPPFVVLRRTSRPGPGPGGVSRGMGVLVDGNMPIAVDNHLITLAPHDGSVDTCRELLKRLSRPVVAEWLDDRIRCRHLTVTAVREIPW